MTEPSTLNFLLVPDAGAARRIRRCVAAGGACGGVVVGTWGELLEWARRTYLLSELADDWETAFGDALTSLEDAFWAESFKVAPVETAEAVERALVEVLSATDPSQGLQGVSFEGLAERPRRHLAGSEATQ